MTARRPRGCHRKDTLGVGLIADHVSARDRGLAMGLFEAACGVSILVAGLVGGYSAEVLGAEAPYLLVAGIALAWTVVLARRLPPSAVHSLA